MPASAIDVSFCGAATTASTSPASASLIAVPAKASAARPLAALLVPKSSAAMSDHAQLGRDAAGCEMPFEHAGIADHDRLAGVAHGGIERSFEADLRSDARRVARGDGNSRVVAHGWTP